MPWLYLCYTSVQRQNILVPYTDTHIIRCLVLSFSCPLTWDAFLKFFSPCPKWSQRAAISTPFLCEKEKVGHVYYNHIATWPARPSMAMPTIPPMSTRGNYSIGPNGVNVMRGTTASLSGHLFFICRLGTRMSAPQVFCWHSNENLWNEYQTFHKCKPLWIALI